MLCSGIARKSLMIRAQWLTVSCSAALAELRMAMKRAQLRRSDFFMVFEQYIGNVRCNGRMGESFSLGRRVTPLGENMDDAAFMREALRMAHKAHAAEEVPVGAIVVRSGKIIARAYNQVELLKDATAHAEMLAITQAEAAVGDWRLGDCDLYVTKEPCPMCAGAIVHARLRRVVFGCADPRAGAAGSVLNLLQMPTLNHHCDITAGVLREESAVLLQE